MHNVRSSTPDDELKIQALYKKVARISGGIAVREDEVSIDYIKDFMKKSMPNGFNLVVDHPTISTEIIGEVHCYPLQPRIFNHVLGELTIAVDPDFHGMGVGKNLLGTLQTLVKTKRPDILRIELFTNETNTKSLALYERMGFIREGKLMHRLKWDKNTIEADIPLAWFNPNYHNIK